MHMHAQTIQMFVVCNTVYDTAHYKENIKPSNKGRTGFFLLGYSMPKETSKIDTPFTGGGGVGQ